MAAKGGHSELIKFLTERYNCSASDTNEVSVWHLLYALLGPFHTTYTILILFTANSTLCVSFSLYCVYF